MQHVAIMRQPFFNMVLNGEKTIESRWSMKRVAPFGRVKTGDTILFKETGKPVTAMATASRVECLELTPEIVDQIRLKYGKQIGIDKLKTMKTLASKGIVRLFG